MIEFKDVEISDKKWMDPLLKAANYRGCHFNFTNIFAWAPTYNYQVAEVEGFLVVKGKMNRESYYFYPAGEGNPKPAVDAIIENSRYNGNELTFVGISPDHREMLDSLMPGCFDYTDNRGAYDYLYLLEKLATLSGRKLNKKRNHVNAFKRNEDWDFEEITPENLQECRKMSLEWCRENHCADDAQLRREAWAVRRCFENFEALGLLGGLLRKDGKIIAFTMGDKLNSDTFDIHIEKAYSEIRGAYQMINYAFANLIKEKHPEIIYVNREEDMDIEGLRKAKMSYYPIKLEEKYTAKMKLK